MKSQPTFQSLISPTKFNILLIEDNNEDALLIQEYLGLAKRFSFQLTRVGTLWEGIESLQKSKPDIILLDLTLPDSKGYRTFWQVAQQAQGVPILLLTGLDDETLALQAIREGAQDYLVKSDLSSPLLTRAIVHAIERKQIEDALRESQERYALAVEGVNDGLWDWDLRNNRLYLSPRWKQMLGYEENEIKDLPDEWMRRDYPADVPKLRAALASQLRNGENHFECEYRMLHKNGDVLWVLTRGIAIRDAGGKPYRIAGSQTDITQRKRTEERLQYEALHDSLTGLPNRVLFLDRLGRAIERQKRRKEYKFAVLFLDLDRFKVINDSLGHLIGDQLLIVCAKKIQSCLRSIDTVSRLSGDEFIILLEDIQAINDAVEVAERIQQDLRTPVNLDNHPVVISASIGIVPSAPHYHRAEEYLRDADIAMYQAKMVGKACYALFDGSMHQRAVNRMELENDLRQAMESGILQVHYQPIVSLQNWKIVGFEALLRWKHPQRGYIPPKEFIPMAEETGLIHSLGLWVLRQACCQMQLWQKLYPSEPRLNIHVNISGKQLNQPGLVESIQQILFETQLPPENLCLELTESLFVENDEAFNETLQRLCSLGIQLQIDDFGTGYSSFSYLNRLPVSSIKIDSTFIGKMSDNKNQAEIVRTIVNLAQNLGITAIAEGVESAEQLTQLQQLNCKYGQGYYISKPITGELGREMLLRTKETGCLR